MALKENHQNLYDRVVRNIDDLILEKFADVDHTVDDTTEGWPWSSRSPQSLRHRPT